MWGVGVGKQAAHGWLGSESGMAGGLPGSHRSGAGAEE